MPGKRVTKRVAAPRRATSRRLVLRVTLRFIEPPVWRELSVPDSYSLLQLHRCLQLAFDWLDYHLFAFDIGGRLFTRPGPDALGEDAGGVALWQLGLTCGSTFLYSYDMGDGWEHDIEVRATELVANADDALLVLATDGARAGPPEDVGGPPGYERLVQALQHRADPDDEDLVAWAGDFDPERFDKHAVNHALVLASAWRVI